MLVTVGIGLANVLYAQQFKQAGAPMRLEPMPALTLPILSDLPVRGHGSSRR